MQNSKRLTIFQLLPFLFILGLLGANTLQAQDKFEAEISAIRELPLEKQQDRFQGAIDARRGTPLQLARYHHELGVVYFKLDDLFTAIDETKKALALRLENEKDATEEIAQSAYNLGSFYYNLERFDEAFAHFQLIVDRAPNALVGYTLFRLGSLYRDIGEFQLGEKAFQDALDQPPYPDDEAERATLFMEWADLYLKQNTKAAARQAIPLLEKAYRTYDQLAASDSYYASLAALSLNRFGLAYTNAEAFTRARQYFQQALQYNEQCCEDQSLQASIYTNLGIVYRRMNQAQEALKWHQRSLELRVRSAQTGKTNIGLAITYDNLASTYLHLEQPRQGLENSQQSLVWALPRFVPQTLEDDPPLSLLKASPNKNTLLISLQDKGDLWRALAEKERDEIHLLKALKTYRNCDQLIDLMRADHLEKNTKLFWRDQARKMYQSAVQAAWMADRPEDAFYFSEKSRAVLLLDGLQELNAHSRLPEATRQQLTQLASEIQYLEKEAYQVEESGGAASNEQLSLLQEQYRHLLDSVEQNYPDYYRQKYRPATIQLSGLQQELSQDEVWIEYFLADDFSLALIVTPGKIRMVELAAPQVLQPHINQLIKNLKKYDTPFDPEPARALYEYLLAPLQLPAGASITIVPDGQLSLIPFEALLKTPPDEKDYSQWDFLLKIHPLSYAFSASSRFFSGEERRAGNGKVLAFAPMATLAPDYGVDERLELPQTRFTVDYIAGILPTDVFLGKTARRSQLEAIAPQASVLHLATHAYLDHERPEFSYFLVADADPDQRRFYVNELYQHQYRADLAVLSACETGAGKLFRGEGVASIGRAFAQNGCPNLAMSLWPVDEGATSHLLERYYEKLEAGVPKGEALQQAKLAYLEQATAPELKHPFRWSGFVYYGQNTPLELSDTSGSGRLLWFLPLLLIGAVFLFSRKKKMAEYK